MAHLVSLFLVHLTLVLILEPVLIFNFHVDRVVHHTLVLNGDGQLFDLVFTVDLSLLRSLFVECLLLLLVTVGDCNGVVLVRLPVLLGGLGAHDVNIGVHLLVVML